MELRSNTVMMNVAPNFLGNSLQLGTYANSAAFQTALLQWCYSSRNFGANPTVSAGNGTSADDEPMQVDSLEKSEGEGQRQTPESEWKSHEPHKQHEPYRHQHVQELWRNWTSGERLLETSWRRLRQSHQEQQPHAERQEPQERQREKQTRGRCGNESAF